jgi:hypothetical protein
VSAKSGEVASSSIGTPVPRTCAGRGRKLHMSGVMMMMLCETVAYGYGGEAMRRLLP